MENLDITKITTAMVDGVVKKGRLQRIRLNKIEDALTNRKDRSYENVKGYLKELMRMEEANVVKLQKVRQVG